MISNKKWNMQGNLTLEHNWEKNKYSLSALINNLQFFLILTKSTNTNGNYLNTLNAR